MHPPRLAVICAFAALLCGCGEPKHSVSGTVTFSDGGRVYEGTAVVFTTADGFHSGYAVVTGPTGAFQDVSFEADGDGLPAGTYSVVLRPPSRWAVPKEVALSAPPNFGIDPKYMAPETSGFRLEVKDDVTDYHLSLRPAKAKAILPREKEALAGMYVDEKGGNRSALQEKE